MSKGIWRPTEEKALRLLQRAINRGEWGPKVKAELYIKDIQTNTGLYRVWLSRKIIDTPREELENQWQRTAPDMSFVRWLERMGYIRDKVRLKPVL